MAYTTQNLEDVTIVTRKPEKKKNKEKKRRRVVIDPCGAHEDKKIVEKYVLSK